MSKRAFFTKRKEVKVQKVLIFIHTKEVLTNAHHTDIFGSRMPLQALFSSFSDNCH